MDKYIDSRFERLEKALSSLIDSVTKYHPSTVQAEELRAADDELSKGLVQGMLDWLLIPLFVANIGPVQVHQNNLLRIQKLRDESTALDAQIRDTLSTLASTRKDIVSTHTTTYPSEPNYPIAYQALLSYARRISKTTMPPEATVEAVPPPEQPQSAVTPSAPSLPQTPAVNGATQQNTSLPEGMSQFLNPLSGQLFFPWPLEDKIRSGSLASYQVIAEQGIDPKGYDPAMEEERKRKEEEERKEREEREKAEREEQERKLREERERARIEREKQREKEQDTWRRGSVAGQPDGAAARNPGPAAKKQFQFTNLDDLDDDDDEE